MGAAPHIPNGPENRAKRAFKALSQVRSTLYNRLVDLVLANRPRLRDEAAGNELGTFTIQTIDEHVMKMNVIDRAMGELARPEPREGQTTTTTYETVEVIAKRDELPQKIADALAERGESDFLDLCVLRADELTAEVLLVLAREDHDVVVPAQNAQRNEKDKKEKGQSGQAGPGGQAGNSGPAAGGQSGPAGSGEFGDDIPNGL